MQDFTEDPRYPAGRFDWPEIVSRSEAEKFIREIEIFPAELRRTVEPLSAELLDSKTLPGVWSVRQVVHHLADSHMNSFIRFKLALTEESPTVKNYLEGRWAELPDGKEAPLKFSLELLDALHSRWVILLDNLGEEDLQRTFFSPEMDKNLTLGFNIAFYAWHGRHHLGHIRLFLTSKGIET